MTIYGLYDPRNDQLRYIGQTRKPLVTRLKGHIAWAKQCMNGAWYPPVSLWIISLLLECRQPDIRTLCLASEVTANMIELAVIRGLHASGADLLNSNGIRKSNEQYAPAWHTMQDRDHIVAAWRSREP